MACAERVGAWILADEVYRGAERCSDEDDPSFYGRYDKVIAMGSMSKAYGLPGLRIGWAVGPPPTAERHLGAPRVCHDLGARCCPTSSRPLPCRPRRGDDC